MNQKFKMGLAAALILAAVLAVAAPVADIAQPVKLEFPQAGYRINALESVTKLRFSFTMTLPDLGKGQSLPEVKVTMQPTTERPSFPNLKEAKTIRTHFSDTILLERTPSPTEWLMEYTSDKTGKKEHTYQRVFFVNDMAYDISATAPDTQWPELGPKLKACVDSFELSPTQAPNKVTFPQQGFRINKLDGSLPADAHLTLLSMDKVFVGIAPYAKTLQDYQTEHKPRVTMPNLKFKILSENALKENALVTEYVAEIPIPGNRTPPQVSQMHIYEKVVLTHGQYYWATGIHVDVDKAVSSAQIKDCVESLEALPLTAPAPAPASTATSVSTHPPTRPVLP